MKLLPTKTGITVGIFVGAVHFVWSVLIAFGWAQPLVDFVLWLHMITLPIVVTDFIVIRSVLLILITFGVGFIGGWLFALLWNKLHKV